MLNNYNNIDLSYQNLIHICLILIYKMGIQGLLQSIKEITTKKNLKDYAGKIIGVDSYAWLHKIIKSYCTDEIVKGILTNKYVQKCWQIIQNIQKLNIKVIMVFDGGHLPCKSGQQLQRNKKRAQSLAKARQCFQQGQTEQAKKNLIKAIDITPQIAYKLIKKLRQMNVQYIVAPYEADAQLAYLSRNNLIDVVITQDSDLLAFGAKRVFYKMDLKILEGQQIILQNIKQNKELSFRYFDHNMFLKWCILRGCDYLESIEGIGLKKSFQLIKRNKTFKKVLNELRSIGKEIPADYYTNLIKAFLTFRFQYVYCPLKCKTVKLNTVNLQQLKQKFKNNEQIQKVTWYQQILDHQILAQLSQKQEWGFLGKYYTEEEIQDIAAGNIDPVTLQRFKQQQIIKLQGFSIVNKKKQIYKKNKMEVGQRTLQFQRKKKQIILVNDKIQIENIKQKYSKRVTQQLSLQNKNKVTNISINTIVKRPLLLSIPKILEDLSDKNSKILEKKPHIQNFHQNYKSDTKTQEKTDFNHMITYLKPIFTDEFIKESFNSSDKQIKYQYQIKKFPKRIYQQLLEQNRKQQGSKSNHYQKKYQQIIMNKWDKLLNPIFQSNDLINPFNQ